MSEDEALVLLKQNLKSPNLIKHSLSVQAGMKALAKYFGKDEEKWGICGLLHDIDYEKVNGDINLHSKVGSEMLRKLGVDSEICDAIFTHNDAHGISPKTLMAKALYCTDPLTGLIVASALVIPSKRLEDLQLSTVLHKFKQKSFAKGANREIIKKCEPYLNIPLKEFIGIVLKAMQSISDKLGL